MAQIEIDGEFFDNPVDKARSEKAFAIAKIHIDSAVSSLKVISSKSDSLIKEIQLESIKDSAMAQSMAVISQPLFPAMFSGEVVNVNRGHND